MTFPIRWKIQGTLTTRSLLHIGSGQSPIPVTLQDGANVKPSSVIRNGQGMPMLPGSTVRGKLRAWLRDHDADDGLMNQVFGQEATEGEADTGIGGKAEFFDACLAEMLSDGARIPYWDIDRQTGITTSVVLNRTTHTAQKELLAHQEAVPEGAKFHVILTGQGLTEEEVGLLLYGFAGFNDSINPALIGSDTGRGWGQMFWELESIHYFGREQLDAWLEKDDGSMWFTIMEPVVDLEDFKTRNAPVLREVRPSLVLDLLVSFNSQFLINDPSQTVAEGSPNFTPIVDQDNKAKLLTKSLHGALRSQAERIVRSMGGRACRPDLGKGKACRAIHHLEEIEELCPVCRVFGAGGWKAPFELMEIQPDVHNGCIEQEYVAIDRFTGGGVDGFKFKSKAAWKPGYKVMARIDLTRIHLWGAGLIALVLRDLAEGDIPIGYMKRNIGSCRARLRKVDLFSLDHAPEFYSRIEACSAGNDPNFSISALTPKVKELINTVLRDFRDHIHPSSTEIGGAA